MVEIKTVFAVVGRTESGDDFVYVLDKDASELVVDALIARDMPIEYEEVGFTNWHKTELAITPTDSITGRMILDMLDMVAKSESSEATV